MEKSCPFGDRTIVARLSVDVRWMKLSGWGSKAHWSTDEGHSAFVMSAYNSYSVSKDET